MIHLLFKMCVYSINNLREGSTIISLSSVPFLMFPFKGDHSTSHLRGNLRVGLPATRPTTNSEPFRYNNIGELRRVICTTNLGNLRNVTIMYDDRGCLNLCIGLARGLRTFAIERFRIRGCCINLVPKVHRPFSHTFCKHNTSYRLSVQGVLNRRASRTLLNRGLVFGCRSVRGCCVGNGIALCSISIFSVTVYLPIVSE